MPDSFTETVRQPNQSVPPTSRSLEIIRDNDANATIRDLHREAFSFLTLALASFTPQLVLEADILANPKLQIGLLIGLILVLVSDFLTATFAMSVIARFDLVAAIRVIKKPWAPAQDIFDAATDEMVRMKRIRTDEKPFRIARKWFSFEDAFLGVADRDVVGIIERALSRARGIRHGIIICSMLAVFAAVGLPIILRCVGAGWWAPF